jgi:hypothetical protein
MKNPSPRRLLHSALASATIATAAADPVILLQETFPANSRSTQNLPGSAQWLLARSASPSGISNGAWSITALNETARSFFGLAYFTASGSPLELKVGDSLTLAFQASVSNASGGGQGLRFGFFHSKGARLTGDISTTSSTTLNGYSGYGVFSDFKSSPSATGSLQIMRRPGGADALFTGQAVGGFTIIGASGTAPSVAAASFERVTLKLKRINETSVEITTTVAGTALVRTDSTLNLTTFDSVSIFSDGNSGTVSLRDITVALGDLPEPPPPEDPVPLWQAFRNANFGPDVTASANPLADPDGDGMVNLLELAFGGDPHKPGTASMPAAQYSAAENQFTLAYRKASEGIDYLAEWSPDLSPGSWSGLGFGPEIATPASGWFSRLIQWETPNPRAFVRMRATLSDPPVLPRANGFRGIWFELGQVSAYGDKYSGGLGTYTANHVPMAIYSPEVHKTYFTWGGTPTGTQKRLLILISYFDHHTGLVARPVVVMDKGGVDDPHDNASLSIDEEGHLWVFVSGRNTSRLGSFFRSRVPYGINDWTRLPDAEVTYPQPWWFEGKGFLHTYTRYVSNRRELFWRTTRNGKEWSAENKLAGFGGHYQTSEQVGHRVITAFNRHPNGNVDQRTDLYYAETADMGQTWTTADGTVLNTPLLPIENPARIRNYSTQPDPANNALVYIHDTTADAEGRPVILYITSKNHQPGPNGDPRTWMIARWTGTEWLFHPITTSTHNYDTGSIYIEQDGTWRVIGPTEPGPQPWGTGGEIAVWTSSDRGATWTKQRNVTTGSPRNHSYARRPRHAHPDFYAYWADGHADTFSESHLYFTNREGDKVWQLPYNMTEEFAAPQLLNP